jgi:putative membrane protein
MYYLFSFIVSAGAIFFIAQSGNVDGITLADGYTSALIFAVILAIVNLLLGTILRLITFPLRLITLGLFSFVISAILVYVTDQLVDVVTISGWIPVVVIAIVTTIISFIMKIFK